MRTLLIALVYDFTEIVEKFISAIDNEAGIDIIIVENPSPNSPSISAIVRKRFSRNVIAHAVFDRNIKFNAVQQVVDSNFIDWFAYDHVIVTDGDLVPEGDWHERLICVLRNNPEVFCCGMSVSLANKPQSLPIATIKPVPEIEHADFVETRVGWTFQAFRISDFYQFLAYRRKWNIVLHDREIWKFANYQRQMKTGRLKTPHVYHLTWDYSTPMYRDNKLDRPDPWDHDEYCGFSLTHAGGFFARVEPKWTQAHQSLEPKRLRIVNYDTRPLEAIISVSDEGFISRDRSITILPRAINSHVLVCGGNVRIVARQVQKSSTVTVSIPPFIKCSLPSIHLIPPDKQCIYRFYPKQFESELGRPQYSSDGEEIFLHASHAPSSKGRVRSHPAILDAVDEINCVCTKDGPLDSPKIAFRVNVEIDGMIMATEVVAVGGNEAKVLAVDVSALKGKALLLLDTYPVEGQNNEFGWCKFGPLLFLRNTAG